MRESAIENAVVHAATRAGYFVRKLAWTGVDGAPDRVFSRADRGVVFIEFKAPGKRPAMHQTLEHEAMRSAGMEVHVCDNVADAKRVLWLA